LCDVHTMHAIFALGYGHVDEYFQDGVLQFQTGYAYKLTEVR